MERMLPSFKTIEILSSTPYIPYSSICLGLVSNLGLQKEFNSLKNKIKYHPLPTFSNGRSYLTLIAKLFGVQVTFKKLKNDDELRGACWPEDLKIEIALHDDPIFNRRTLTHEIAHILQIKLGLADEMEDIYLSEELRQEQQAEAISYYLHRILWPSEKIIRSSFNCYFKEEDIVWLHHYFSSIDDIVYINDVFVFKKKKQ